MQFRKLAMFANIPTESTLSWVWNWRMWWIHWIIIMLSLKNNGHKILCSDKHYKDKSIYIKYEFASQSLWIIAVAMVTKTKVSRCYKFLVNKSNYCIEEFKYFTRVVNAWRKCTEMLRLSPMQFLARKGLDSEACSWKEIVGRISVHHDVELTIYQSSDY